MEMRRSSSALSLLLCAAVTLGSTCEQEDPGGPCPPGLARVGSGITACAPRCGLDATHREYEMCPQGFMCSAVTGCYLPCGSSACYPGERCNAALMRCERVPDAGVADGTVPPDVVSPSPDVVSPPPDVVSPPPDVVSPPPDVVSPPPDVVGPPTDTGSGGASCSMGLPSSGITSVLGSGSGISGALRLAVSDSHIAWSDGGNLALNYLDGNTVGRVTTAGVQHLALTATHVYFVILGSRSAIYRSPVAGFVAATPQLVRETAAYIPAFALGADAILWAEEDARGATIYRADLDGQRASERGALSYQGRSSERVIDMAAAGQVLYVATQQSLGTTGCYRVVRYDAGPVMPSSPAPTVVYGPTSGSCTAASYSNLAFDGDTLFFHSSSPPEIVQYAPGSTASRFAGGFGDGTFLGLTPRCVIGSNGGLFGISRALPVSGARIPLGFNGTPLGRIVVRGAYVYGFVQSRTQYSVFRYGL